MPVIVWLVLNDGRSVVAGCGSASRDALVLAMAEKDRTLTFTSDDSVEHVPSSFVRGYTVFETKSRIPPATSIYRFLQL